MSRQLEPYQQIERSIQKTYHKRLWTPFITAVKQYDLIAPGDRIAACISGGKDSMLMAKLLQLLQRHSDVPFEVVYLVMDPGYNAANRQKIEYNAALLHIPVTIFSSDIFEVTSSVGSRRAISARGCAAAISTARRASSAATRSPSATISATWSRRPS